MKSNMLEKLNIVDKLKGRGKNILMVGPTGVGKTHLINSIVPNILKVYLSIREGEGLATLKTTTTVLSDYVGLNDEEFIITGRINQIDKYDRNIISECEKLLLDITYEPIKNSEKELSKTGNSEKAFETFKSQVEKQIDNFKIYNDNTKLSFKIKNVDNYDNILKEKLLSDETMLKKNWKVFIDIYRRSKVYAKSQDIKRVFIDEITSKASIYIPNEFNDAVKQNTDENEVRKFIDTLVDSIIYIYNIAADEFLNSIKNVEDANVDEGRNFTIVVNKDNYDINSKLLKSLIGVMNDTKSYYVDNPTIYIKKDFNEILNEGDGNTSDYYKTFIENGIEYHSMKIIDSQGLFHKNEETDKECERIIDLLAEYQCNDIIYVISAKNDALTKKAKDVLKYLKNTCKKNININLAVTHIDEKISSKLNSASDGDFGDFSLTNVNIENLLNEVIEDQNVELQNELINDGSNSKVKIDPNVSYFSYPTYKESIDTKLRGLYDYNSNVNRLLLKVAKNSKTYYIELKTDGMPVLDINAMLDNVLGNETGKSNSYDVSNIYLNLGINYYMLFGTPKVPPLKIHHRTYEEAIIYWKDYALKFKSEAKGSLTGYAPIETYFVEYMRSFIRESVVAKAKIDLSKVELKEQTDDNVNRFKEEFANYLKNEVSRCVTIDIYYAIISRHAVVYDYRLDFMNILLECAKKFFPSESISLVDGENLKNKSISELQNYFTDDKSDGLAKIVILTIFEINNAIEQFIKNYCVVRF